jgi:hypothetical protein
MVISMNKEKPQATSYRFYAKQRRIIKSISKKLKISDAEVVRRAVDQYEAIIPAPPKGIPQRDLRKMLKVKI